MIFARLRHTMEAEPIMTMGIWCPKLIGPSNEFVVALGVSDAHEINHLAWMPLTSIGMTFGKMVVWLGVS